MEEQLIVDMSVDIFNVSLSFKGTRSHTFSANRTPVPNTSVGGRHQAATCVVPFRRSARARVPTCPNPHPGTVVRFGTPAQQLDSTLAALAIMSASWCFP